MIYEKKGASGILWNPKADGPLCRIEDGRCETSSKEVAAALEKRGFTRIDKPEKPPKE